MEAAGKYYVVHSSRSDTFKLWSLADVHLGSKGCAVNDFKRDVKRIADDPHSLWFGGGDYLDCISYNDKRFHPDSVSPDIRVKDLGELGMVLARQLKNILEPIKYKCVGMLKGNHEQTYEVKHQQDLLGWLCAELGVAKMGYSAFFDLMFMRSSNKIVQKAVILKERPKVLSGIGATSFRVFAHHGAGYATTPGGKLNKLIAAMDHFDADIYFLAHVHDQKAERLVTLGANEPCDKIVSKEKLGIVTGSYLKTYEQGATLYGEQRMYRPVPLGARWVSITPDKRELRAEI